MTTPTNCPHCGAEKLTQSTFECGTWESGAGRLKHCYEREIAQLKGLHSVCRDFDLAGILDALNSRMEDAGWTKTDNYKPAT